MKNATRSWVILAALGLGFLGSATVSRPALAAPGADDQARAALREARALFKEAAALEAKADDGRDAARKAYFAALKRAHEVDEQAELKKAQARRKLNDAGGLAAKERAADGYRTRATGLRIQADQMDHAADAYAVRVNTERARAKAQREAAELLLKGTPDGDLQKEAAELKKAAEQDDHDAAEFAKLEAEARKRAADLRTQAAALVTRANQLDPDGK